jgi:hypothetical protein
MNDIKEYPTVTCHICSKKQKACYCEPYQSNMINKNLCFNCLFWEDHIEADKSINKDTFVIVDKGHYLINPEKATGMRGFGGRPFYIKFNDGRKICSTNLWYQGIIPEYFIDRMPNNAIFVNEKEFLS